MLRRCAINLHSMNFDFDTQKKVEWKQFMLNSLSSIFKRKQDLEKEKKFFYCVMELFDFIRDM